MDQNVSEAITLEVSYKCTRAKVGLCHRQRNRPAKPLIELQH